MSAGDYLAASNGSGEAVTAIVTTLRDVGHTDLITDSVLNWPSKFVATVGTYNAVTGLIEEGTITIFKGHLTGSIITIDVFAPGYTDIGNSVNQVVMLKPNTFWADTLAAAINGTVQGVAAGTNISVNNTDPTHPIITATATPLTIKDEGTPLTSTPSSLNFAGAGVVASAVGNDVTVQIDATPPPDASTTVKGLVKLAGDLGGTALLPTVPGLATHIANVSNPHSVTKAQVGLGNVDNTSNATERAATATLSGKTLTGGLVTADPTAALGIASKQYVDALGTTSIIKNETPGGSVNGSNVAFTTASTFATGSLRVYLNGQRLKPGGADFTEGTQAFTMAYAPLTGDVLIVDYDVSNTAFVQGSNSIIVQETPTGSVNSSNTVFTTLQAKYVANSLEVFVNGLQQTKTTDYAETTPGSGVFTMTVAPVTGDAVRVSYQFSTGASGNADTVDGIHASATPVANALLALTANSRFKGTSMVNVLLDNVEVADLFSGLSCTANTWTDLKANQNFTVSSANSIIVIIIECGMQAGTTVATAFGSRAVIDSAGTPIYRGTGATGIVANSYANPFSGNAPIILTGLSAGVHTVKTQIYPANTVLAYCRPTGAIYENYRTTVIEIGG